LDGKLRLLDSFNFFPSSLDALVKGLKKNNASTFPITRKIFSKYLSDPSIIIGKGHFPHEFITWETLYEKRTSIPPKSAFDSSLNESQITFAEHAHVQYLFTKLKCQSLADLSYYYCLSDTLQLADIVLYYQNLCMNKFGVDLFKFYSTSSLAYFIALVESAQPLEYIKDKKQQEFVRNFIRGANVFTPIRYAVANNPMLPGYDAKKPHRFLFMYDVNSLYGHILTQDLYVGEPRWLSASEISKFDLDKTLFGQGYIIKCDIKIPHHLHEYFVDFCPLTEKYKYLPEQFSDYQRELMKQYNMVNIEEELS